MCLGCGEKRPKKEMIRIVRNAENEFHVDATRRMNGRGCYVCPDSRCMQAVVKQKKLAKSFEMNVSVETYTKITDEFEALLKNGGSNIG